MLAIPENVLAKLAAIIVNKPADHDSLLDIALAIEANFRLSLQGCCFFLLPFP